MVSDTICYHGPRAPVRQPVGAGTAPGAAEKDRRELPSGAKLRAAIANQALVEGHRGTAGQ